MKSKPDAVTRVVVADDDRDTVTTLLELLRTEGYEARGATNGTEALRLVQGFGADVLLLDLGMPGMSGYEVAEELRERYGGAHPVLIALTGRAAPVDRRLARAAGFDHFISKPYDPAELLALLRSLRALA